jgi:hypothetical protein
MMSKKEFYTLVQTYSSDYLRYKKDNEILIEVLTWEDGLVGLSFCPYEFLKWFQDKPSIKQTKDMINNYVKRI